MAGCFVHPELETTLCARDGERSVMADSRLAGRPSGQKAVWSGPLPPHTLENVGESELRVISVELKTVPLLTAQECRRISSFASQCR
jgi:hypothetical protein